MLLLVLSCLSRIKCLMTSTSRRNKCGITWLGHSCVRRWQWMKARSRGAAMGCLVAEFHIGEVLVNGVSLAVPSGFASSEFTISHLAMHPYTWAREAQTTHQLLLVRGHPPVAPVHLQFPILLSQQSSWGIT